MEERTHQAEVERAVLDRLASRSATPTAINQALHSRHVPGRQDMLDEVRDDLVGKICETRLEMRSAAIQHECQGICRSLRGEEHRPEDD